MNREPFTLGDLLLGPPAPSEARTQTSVQRQRDLEQSDSVGAVKKALEGRSARFPWSYALEQVEAKVLDVLDVKVEDILGATWSKVSELAKYLDPEKYPPEETILAHLAEHTIKSTFHPSLEVLFNEEQIGEIRFDVTVALAVKGLMLKIQGGKILEAKTGSCQGKGTVAIAGHTIVERKSEEIALPGVISFEKGKRIEALGAPVD